MPRFLKQFLYGIFYLAIFIGIPAGIYLAFLKPAPTCTDGIRNGDEQGIDCGGVCVKACIPADILPLEAPAGMRIIPLDNTHTSFFAEVINPNVGYAATRFRYAVTVERKTGSNMLFSGTSYIYGGQVRALVFPNLELSDSDITNVKIEFSDSEWIPSSSWMRPQFRVLNIATQQDPPEGGGTLVAEGELVSDEVISFPSVEIVAVFIGRFGEVAGVSRTEVSSVSPAIPVRFTVTHPDISDVNASATRIMISALRP
ncbi:MAG: hypothetical protein NUV53_04030 [Patescibacteria group bacterium]|nr:hypothetical protein [Patescibacteria group bacterium]